MLSALSFSVFSIIPDKDRIPYTLRRLNSSRDLQKNLPFLLAAPKSTRAGRRPFLLKPDS